MRYLSVCSGRPALIEKSGTSDVALAVHAVRYFVNAAVAGRPIFHAASLARKALLGKAYAIFSRN
jgi:hypothetical protein